MFFDDLKVTHTQRIVTEAKDYYPGGLVQKHLITPGIKQYRYGYQGEYSEQEDDLGWNSFELRMYDPVINRWISNDPYGQFWSPYVGMGNDWANQVDPDGGCVGAGCLALYQTAQNALTVGANFYGEFVALASSLNNASTLWETIQVANSVGSATFDGRIISHATGPLGANNWSVEPTPLANPIERVGISEANFGTSETIGSGQIAAAALGPSFEDAARRAFSQGSHNTGRVPFFLKKNIFKSPHAPNNNALRLPKIPPWLAKSGAEIFKVGGPLLAFTGIGYNLYDIAKDDRLTWGDGFVFVNTIAQVAFPVYGVLYGLGDLGSKWIFGTSITEWGKSLIDNNVKGSLDISPITNFFKIGRLPGQ